MNILIHGFFNFISPIMDFQVYFHFFLLDGCAGKLRVVYFPSIIFLSHHSSLLLLVITIFTISFVIWTFLSLRKLLTTLWSGFEFILVLLWLSKTSNPLLERMTTWSFLPINLLLLISGLIRQSPWPI